MPCRPQSADEGMKAERDVAAATPGCKPKRSEPGVHNQSAQCGSDDSEEHIERGQDGIADLAQW